jgi:hypothetical protein
MATQIYYSSSEEELKTLSKILNILNIKPLQCFYVPLHKMDIYSKELNSKLLLFKLYSSANLVIFLLRDLVHEKDFQMLFDVVEDEIRIFDHFHNEISNIPLNSSEVLHIVKLLTTETAIVI